MKEQHEAAPESPEEDFSADLAFLNRIAVYSLPRVANAHADAARVLHNTSSFDGRIFKRPGGGASAADALWCRLRDGLQRSMATAADNLHDSAEAVVRIVEDFKEADLYNEGVFKEKMVAITQHEPGLPTPYLDPPKPGDATTDGTFDSLVDG